MAIETATANSQHYEVATGFLRACLGPRMKYSCCLYPTGKETLGHAEVEMLETYIEKAELADGMKILDLGCGTCYSRSCGMADRANEVAVGDLELFTSLKYFQTPRSQHSPTQEHRKHTLLNRPRQKSFQILPSSLETSWITNLMQVLLIV